MSITICHGNLSLSPKQAHNLLHATHPRPDYVQCSLHRRNSRHPVYPARKQNVVQYMRHQWPNHSDDRIGIGERCAMRVEDDVMARRLKPKARSAKSAPLSNFCRQDPQAATSACRERVVGRYIVLANRSQFMRLWFSLSRDRRLQHPSRASNQRRQLRGLQCILRF